MHAVRAYTILNALGLGISVEIPSRSLAHDITETTSMEVPPDISCSPAGGPSGKDTSKGYGNAGISNGGAGELPPASSCSLL